VQQNGSGVSFVPTTGVSNGHLGMAHFRKLLEEVRPNFDVILFDGPPVFDADTITVASLVKKVVLVVESGRTRYEMLERAKAELAGENVEIVGAILNKQKYFIPGWVYRWVIA
jgi:Mrp family chromosome partitioning ATPase